MQKPSNTEDKLAYCKWGEEMEVRFCKEIAPTYGFEARINPEKEHNKYAVDLLVRRDFSGAWQLTDLKCVGTPFFTAGRYGFNPDHTVTLNTKDVDRYKDKDIVILFYVDWPAQVRYNFAARARRGIWTIHESRLGRVLGPKHSYGRRVGDVHNAIESHLIDLRGLSPYYLNNQKDWYV